MHSEVHLINGKPAVVNVLVDGELYTAIAGLHPNFPQIVEALEANPQGEQVVDLFDIQRAVTTKFQRLTDRVVVENGEVLYDGDKVNDVLSQQIMRFVEEGVDDWKPLVAFLENVQANPNANSREQLYLWLKNGDFTITPEGNFVGYKGCYLDNGIPVSTRSAPAKDQVRVDDEPIVDKPVPNVAGTVVTMPRSVVDPAEGRYCSVGLHVGTWAYASGFATHVVEVHVNPRDVVSVTSDSGRQKIRCCRYTVIGQVTDRYAQATLPQAAAKRAQDVTKARIVDTRDNYKSQKRYPKGHPRAGQFIPKGA